MQDLMLLITFVLAVVAAVITHKALSASRKVMQDNDSLMTRVKLLEDTVNKLIRVVNERQAVAQDAQTEKAEQGVQSETEAQAANNQTPSIQAMNVKQSDSQAQNSQAQEPSQQAASISNPSPVKPQTNTDNQTQTADDFFTSALTKLAANLQQHWMSWLGGICIALAGIFMVRYSIEQGLLSPLARIVLALMAALAMHVGAELWRRRSAEYYPAIAALAAGASISLFASIFAAFSLYQLLSAPLAFVLLAAVALMTLYLSLLHGPVLAAMGLLGAYSVPILLSTGGGNVSVALLYSLVIFSASLILLRHVFRTWLLLGTLVGVVLWWFIALELTLQNNVTWLPLYLSIVLYLLHALIKRDYWLKNISCTFTLPKSITQLNVKYLSQLDVTLVVSYLLTFLYAVTLFRIEGWQYQIYYYWPMLALVALLAQKNPLFNLLPWLSFIASTLALFYSLDQSLQYLGLSLSTEQLPIGCAALLALAFFVSSLQSYFAKPSFIHHMSSSLVWLAPTFALLGCYLLAVSLMAISWHWAVLMAMIAAVYIVLAKQNLAQLETLPGAEKSSSAFSINAIWQISAAHICYSLAAVIFLEQASLTLAIALQVISLTWLMQKYQLDFLKYLIKLVVSLILIRLTLNPWLADYPAEMNWPLWTYGGACLSVYVAGYIYQQQDNLKQWLTAASLHLFVLFLYTEVRFLLYDGDVFSWQQSLSETVINLHIWSALALVYYRRAQLANSLSKIYLLASKVVMVLAAICAVLIYSYYNPLFSFQPSRGVWLLNTWIFTYLTPAILCLLAYRFYFAKYRKFFAISAGFSIFYWLSFQVRDFFHDGSVILSLGISNAEQYSYSLLWLVLALLTFALSVLMQNRSVYKASLLLLAMVIIKLFIIDMADLNGLLRVFSFLGLGLSLLGLAFLHQYLDKKQWLDKIKNNKPAST